MKKIATIAAVTAIALTGAVPAQAAGFVARESWVRGSQGIEKWVDSVDCDFMRSHVGAMQIKAGASFEVNRDHLMNSQFVRTYMDRRVDQGAGSRANMIPADVRHSLRDLGILGTLKKSASCGILDAAADAKATAAYDSYKAEQDARYTNLDPMGIIAELPTLSSGLLPAAR